MAKLKTAENFCLIVVCLNYRIVLDKKPHFKKFKNQSMINNLNNKQRFGAGFRPFFLSTAPSLCLLFIQQGEKKWIDLVTQM